MVSRYKLAKMIHDQNVEAQKIGKHVNEGPWLASQKKFYKTIKPREVPKAHTPDPVKYLSSSYSTSKI